MPRDDNRPGDVRVSLHGPDVTLEDAINAGLATKDLIEAIAHSLAEEVKASIVSIQFRCDGCGLTRPNRPAPDEGWTYHDGDDLCPSCTASRGSNA